MSAHDSIIEFIKPVKLMALEPELNRDLRTFTVLWRDLWSIRKTQIAVCISLYIVRVFLLNFGS